MKVKDSNHWRPDGWKNPHESWEASDMLNLTIGRNSFLAYEQGADAILNALCKNGYPSNEGYEIMKGDTVIQSTSPGIWVFIPTTR